MRRVRRNRGKGFNENYHGVRLFSQLLEEAQARRLIDLEKDEKSGGYIVKALSA